MNSSTSAALPTPAIELWLMRSPLRSSFTSDLSQLPDGAAVAHVDRSCWHSRAAWRLRFTILSTDDIDLVDDDKTDLHHHSATNDNRAHHDFATNRRCVALWRPAKSVRLQPLR